MAEIGQLMAEFTATMISALAVRHGPAEPSIGDQALGAATAVLLRLAFESWLESNQSESLGQSAEKYLEVLCPDAGWPTRSIV